MNLLSLQPSKMKGKFMVFVLLFGAVAVMGQKTLEDEGT